MQHQEITKSVQRILVARDEVNGGYFLVDPDGTVLWQNDSAPHMDSVAIAPWDNGRLRAIC